MMASSRALDNEEVLDSGSVLNQQKEYLERKKHDLMVKLGMINPGSSEKKPGD